jgi:hypothetical protein
MNRLYFYEYYPGQLLWKTIKLKLFHKSNNFPINELVIYNKYKIKLT